MLLYSVCKNFYLLDDFSAGMSEAIMWDWYISVKDPHSRYGLENKFMSADIYLNQ